MDPPVTFHPLNLGWVSLSSLLNILMRMAATLLLKRVVVAKALGYTWTPSKKILTFMEGAHNGSALQLLKVCLIYQILCMLPTRCLQRVVVAKALVYTLTSPKNILIFVEGAHNGSASQLLKLCFIYRVLYIFSQVAFSKLW